MEIVAVPRVVAASAAASGGVPTTRHALTAALAGLALVATPGCSRAQEEVPDEVGPASAYIDLVLGTTEELADQQATRSEEVVAACMAEAGFEYLPNLSAHGYSDHSQMEVPPGSREFAEQYGYGYANHSDEMTTTWEPEDDPNYDRMQAMSASEVAEYELALTGTMHQDYEAAGRPEDFEPDWTHNGCQGKALLEVYRSGAIADATYLALRDEVDRIEAEVVPTDPSVVAADAEWSECMADAGYPGYAAQPDAEARWFEHFMDSGGGGGIVGEDGMTPGQAEMIQEETALATADWDCADQVGYHDVVARVRNAAQEEYVDAHRDELDAWVQKWAEDAA